ncbi:MAG TPA: hypothetical protein VM097_12990 [Mycobacteriales bacterium]|nr:hypothetical protein [Mycobacteriales bacterium]
MKRRFALLLPLLLVLTTSPADAATGDLGYDVSWPQCTGSAFTSVPPTSPAFAVVGVNHGVGRTTNECLAAQAAWAATAPGSPMLYANGADPGPTNGNWPQSGRTSPARCVTASSTSDTGCAYDYGWDLAQDALTRADGQTAFAATSVTWWIDVEVANSWVLDGLMDTASIQGMVDRLRSAGVPDVGIYALTTDWGMITGSSVIGTSSYTRATSSTYRAHWSFVPKYPIEDGPVWFAGAGGQSDAQTRCGTSSFSGGERLLSQYSVTVNTTDWDGDYRCADRDLTAPTATLTAPATGVVTLGTTAVAWGGTDTGGSGVASYDLQVAKAPYNAGLGAWSFNRRLLTRSLTATSPARGGTACWYARSRDAAGNLSALSNRRCVIRPLDDRDLGASSSWARTTAASGWFNSSYSSATRLGATLTKSGLRTSHLELLAYRCPTCGSVTVLLNGVAFKTVSLASSTSGRVRIALPRFSLRTTTVTLRVATSGKLVRIDGLATSGVS